MLALLPHSSRTFSDCIKGMESAQPQPEPTHANLEHTLSDSHLWLGQFTLVSCDPLSPAVSWQEAKMSGPRQGLSRAWDQLLGKQTPRYCLSWGLLGRTHTTVGSVHEHKCSSQVHTPSHTKITLIYTNSYTPTQIHILKSHSITQTHAHNYTHKLRQSHKLTRNHRLTHTVI